MLVPRFSKKANINFVRSNQVKMAETRKSQNQKIINFI